MSSPELPYTIVDAFTGSPFKGNPAAVLTHSRGSPVPSDTTLKAIARELNLPTSVFISHIDGTEGDGGPPTFGIRWITPTGMELPLCGHGTLAAARALFADPSLIPAHHEVINFIFSSGELLARRIQGKIELVFPSGDLTPITDAILQAKVQDVVRRAFGGDGNLRVKFAGHGQGPSFGHLVVVEIDGNDFEIEGAPVDPIVFVSHSGFYLHRY